MLKNESKQAVNDFLASAKTEFAAFADQLSGDTYEKAAEKKPAAYKPQQFSGRYKRKN